MSSTANVYAVQYPNWPGQKAGASSLKKSWVRLSPASTETYASHTIVELNS